MTIAVVGNRGLTNSPNATAEEDDDAAVKNTRTSIIIHGLQIEWKKGAWRNALALVQRRNSTVMSPFARMIYNEPTLFDVSFWRKNLLLSCASILQDILFWPLQLSLKETSFVRVCLLDVWEYEFCSEMNMSSPYSSLHLIMIYYVVAYVVGLCGWGWWRRCRVSYIVYIMHTLGLWD